MKQENLVIELTYRFALEMMSVAKTIRECSEYDLASQLWRAGTSIGANVEEAQAAQSRADFKSKMSIAAKEARETRYWLRLTKEGNILSAKMVDPLLEKIDQILRVLTSIVKSTSENP